MTLRFALLLALLLPAAASAQTPADTDSGTLVVTVVSADGVPLDFADVFLPDLLVGSRTGPDGTTRIEGLTRGEYRVEVTPFRLRATPTPNTIWVGVGTTFLWVPIDGEITQAERPIPEQDEPITTVDTVEKPPHDPNSGVLAGTVTDDQGETLPGVTVFLSEVQRGAATDIDGNYTIVGLPLGTYDVEVSSVGFQQQAISDVQILRNRTRRLNVALQIGAVLVATPRLPCSPEDYWWLTSTYRSRSLFGCEVENRPDRYGDGPALTSGRHFSR